MVLCVRLGTRRYAIPRSLTKHSFCNAVFCVESINQLRSVVLPLCPYWHPWRFVLACRKRYIVQRNLPRQQRIHLYTHGPHSECVRFNRYHIAEFRTHETVRQVWHCWTGVCGTCLMEQNRKNEQVCIPR